MMSLRSPVVIVSAPPRAVARCERPDAVNVGRSDWVGVVAGGRIRKHVDLKGRIARAALSQLFGQVIHQPVVAKDNVVPVHGSSPCRQTKALAGKSLDRVAARATQDNVAADSSGNTVHTTAFTGRERSK